MIPTTPRFRRVFTLLWCALAANAAAQDAPIFTTDFPAEEFQTRREAVLDAVGPGGVAVLQGAGSPLAYQRFRQTNSFYYLTGVETPHAYLLLDGASRRSVLYLPHRNARREASEGRLLTAEDADLARQLTGVDDVFGTWKLSDDLARMAWGNRPPVLHTPLSPAELAAMSRDLATRGNSDIANDPWDGRPSREANFAARLRNRFPKLDIEDLSPVLDRPAAHQERTGGRPHPQGDGPLRPDAHGGDALDPPRDPRARTRRRREIHLLPGRRAVGGLLLAGRHRNQRVVSALPPRGEPARRRGPDPHGLRPGHRLLHERRDPDVAV